MGEVSGGFSERSPAGAGRSLVAGQTVLTLRNRMSGPGRLSRAVAGRHGDRGDAGEDGELAAAERAAQGGEDGLGRLVVHLVGKGYEDLVAGAQHDEGGLGHDAGPRRLADRMTPTGERAWFSVNPGATWAVYSACRDTAAVASCVIGSSGSPICPSLAVVAVVGGEVLGRFRDEGGDGGRGRGLQVLVRAEARHVGDG